MRMDAKGGMDGCVEVRYGDRILDDLFAELAGNATRPGRHICGRPMRPPCNGNESDASYHIPPRKISVNRG